MIKYELFFGFPVDERVEKVLQAVPDNFKQLYIREDSEYLQQRVVDETSYIGKVVGHKVEMKKLPLIQDNIISLLKKICSDFPIESIQLSLFPLKLKN